MGVGFDGCTVGELNFGSGILDRYILVDRQPDDRRHLSVGWIGFIIGQMVVVFAVGAFTIALSIGAMCDVATFLAVRGVVRAMVDGMAKLPAPVAAIWRRIVFSDGEAHSDQEDFVRDGVVEVEEDSFCRDDQIPRTFFKTLEEGYALCG